MALRLMIYDRTDRRPYRPGLSTAWLAGAALYRTMGRFDATRGVSDWDEALDWLAAYRDDELIEEIQFWGHGKWGNAKVDLMPLDVDALLPGHEHHNQLCAIRERLSDDALWWFRTCETFGADAGHDFARRWTDFFGCRAAGHTYVIAYWQSGLHMLGPGMEPTWSTDEGLSAGSPDAPEKSKWSKRREPNTISCLRGAIPDGY